MWSRRYATLIGAGLLVGLLPSPAWAEEVDDAKMVRHARLLPHSAGEIPPRGETTPKLRDDRAAGRCVRRWVARFLRKERIDLSVQVAPGVSVRPTLRGAMDAGIAARVQF